MMRLKMRVGSLYCYLEEVLLFLIFFFFFLANDLVLFCEASMAQVVVVNNILETSYYFSGQKVNFSKSQVFFSPTTPINVVEQICASLGFSNVGNLGSPLNA